MSNHTKVFVNKPSGRHYSQLLGGLKIVPLQQNVALRPTTGTQTKIQQKFYYKFVFCQLVIAKLDNPFFTNDCLDKKKETDLIGQTFVEIWISGFFFS